MSFMFGLQTLHDVGDPAIAARLWELLERDFISPEGFGSTEDAPESFAGSSAAGAETFEQSRVLLIRGGAAGFQAMFQQQRTGWSDWSFWVSEAAVKRDTAKWLEWLFAVCAEFPVLYGYGCSEDELNAKHEEIEELEGGGIAEGTVGLSAEEFGRFLPGVYWLTIFGTELVDHFGMDSLTSIAGTIAEEIDGQLAVRLDEPPVPADIDTRVDREREVAAKIGAEYFFERGRQEYAQIPGLVAKLDAARKK